MKNGYIPRDQRKKIILLSDDCRQTSGIGRMSLEFIIGTAHRYNWVQIAGSVQHPEKGKIINLDAGINKEAGIDDSSVKLYPVDGYGNADILNEVINLEKPDALLHFTDPRFWIWLYQIEREIRQKMPIMYYNIWDDLPAPMYNRAYYESCDALFSISKQTYNINKMVLGPNNCRSIDGEFDADGNCVKVSDVNSKKHLLHYVPHGINVKTFRPLKSEADSIELEIVKKQLFKKKYDYVIFYNSRNIRRKQTSSIMLAYRNFCDNLSKEEASKCVLLMHTQPIDDAGTDLYAIKEAFCPDNDVIFSTDKVLPERLNQYYNIADVTVSMSDNEGFGIGTVESLAAGTPIIVTVTGGLQDQCGFVDDVGNPIEFSMDWGSNHDGKFKKHGSWVTPLYPAARQAQGSISTPHIFADHARWEECAEAMMYWFLLGRNKRKEFGDVGRSWVCASDGLNAENMCSKMIEGIDTALSSWKGRERFNIHRHDEYVGNNMPDKKIGITLPKIDKSKIIEKYSS